MLFVVFLQGLPFCLDREVNINLVSSSDDFQLVVLAVEIVLPYSGRRRDPLFEGLEEGGVWEYKPGQADFPFVFSTVWIFGTVLPWV